MASVRSPSQLATTVSRRRLATTVLRRPCRRRRCRCLRRCRRRGGGADGCVLAATDCGDNLWGIEDCPAFYEGNARTQLTTWNPTPKGAAKVPGGPIDYASKHWAGLIRDYYAARASNLMDLGVAAAKAGNTTVSQAAMDHVRADLAYAWTTAQNKYPMSRVGDAAAVSKAMLEKYRPYFASCGAPASSGSGSSTVL